MYRFKLNNSQIGNKANGLRYILSAMLLCGSIVSGISSLCISPNAINKVKNDGYDLDSGNLNSIIDSPKIELPSVSTAHFHKPNPSNDDFSNSTFTVEYLNSKADIPIDYLPYLRMYFFSYSNKMDSVITNRMLLSQKQFTYYSNDIEMNLDYLRAFQNLEEFNISMNSLEKVTNLPTLQSVKKISIGSQDNNVKIYYTIKLAEAIKHNFANLDTIYFGDNVIFEPGSLECMQESNLKNINIPMGYDFNINCDIDFKQLDYLENIVIRYDDAYDVAVSLNSEEFNHLNIHGTNIIFKNQDDKNDYLTACEKLDKIVEEMKIDSNLPFSKKLDIILETVLKHNCYDKIVSDVNNGDYVISESQFKTYVDQFYSKGFLYGALELDSQLCGNYAAFTKALEDRVAKPDSAYFLTSENHAWILVKDGERLRYVDPTWMDYYDDYYTNDNELTNQEKLALNYGESHPDSIDWYNVDTNMNGLDNDEKILHTPSYVAPYMNVNNAFTDTTKDSYSQSMSDAFMQKFCHMMSREEAINYLHSSQQSEELCKKITMLFLVMSAIILPKKDLLDRIGKKK